MEDTDLKYIRIDGDSLEQIDKENWKKAKGIKYKRGWTNSALTPRDYSVPCSFPHKIGVIKGYWIWWCSAHHQPHSHCEMEKMKIEFGNKIDNFKKEALK